MIALLAGMALGMGIGWYGFGVPGAILGASVGVAISAIVMLDRD